MSPVELILYRDGPSGIFLVKKNTAIAVSFCVIAVAHRHVAGLHITGSPGIHSLPKPAHCATQLLIVLSDTPTSVS